MVVTTVSAYRIGLIAEASRTDRGARLMFRDGAVAYLEAGQPNFEHLLWLAEWSRPNRFVGIVTDAASRMLDLNAAHETGVAWLREFANDRSRFRISFWAYSPICALTREHPEFDRIYATLTSAAGSSQQLWVATYSQETIDEPDEDGLIAALPKIMDVRSADELHA